MVLTYSTSILGSFFIPIDHGILLHKIDHTIPHVIPYHTHLFCFPIIQPLILVGNLSLLDPELMRQKPTVVALAPNNKPCTIGSLPSGYVKIAIENGHRNSGFSH